MKKRMVCFVCCMLLAIGVCACGKKESNLVTTTAESEEDVQMSATPDTTEKSAEDSPKETEAQTAVSDSGKKDEGKTNKESATTPEAKSVTTLEGEYYGFADGNSVEVVVDGEVTVFQVGTDDATKALEKLEEGSIIIFEVQTVDDVQTITRVFQ